MRLTKKDYCGYDIKDRKNFNGYNEQEDCEKLFFGLQKLGQLEDIEDELGNDLITLFKALKNGVYKKDTNGKIKYYNPDQIAINWVGYYPEIVFLNTVKNGDYCALNIKAYKSPYPPTWALTKEELL